MNDRRRNCAIVMERTTLASRWAAAQWAPVAVLPWDAASCEDEAPADLLAPRLMRDDGATAQWLHPGWPIELHADEGEGYYLNLSSPRPLVFVTWELVDDMPRVRALTASYNEAARRMDGGAQVDGVPMPAAWLEWIAAFVDEHYRPEPVKKRVRPASFDDATRER